MRFIELLKEYGDMKLNGSPKEALRIYTDKIMEIAEKYHYYLSSDTQTQFKYNQNLIDHSNGIPVTQYSVHQHEF